MAGATERATSALKRVAAGEAGSLEELLPLVYDDLRRIAERFLQGERAGHTLQATALVHEAYLRLIDQRKARWEDRAHFLALASQLIRRILVDHHRAKHAAKRGGGEERITVTDLTGEQMDLVALHEALERLADIDATQARVVELRFFGGLSIEETGHVLGLSKRTVDREWSCAKAWLYRTLHD